VFYQATASEPQGVVRRRVLRCTGKRVVGVEDDLLDAEADSELPVVGEGALMAQLSRARDRRMHSIVATIQAAQDKAIRAPGRGVVEISGGPGTGKTVVALHRAAYLLYTDRRRYERGGVLVVGPSGVFMRYIERVLPSLGETAVALRSLGEVVDGIDAARHDLPEVAAVKGSARMAELLRRAARQPVPGSPRDFRYFYRDDVLTLTPGDLGRARRSLLGQGGGAGRRNAVSTARVGSFLVDTLWRQVTGERALERSREDFVETVLNDDRFLLFLREWWPPLHAAEVLGWLREPDFLSRIGEGVISVADVGVLTRRDAWGSEAHDLSVEDVPLVDELRHLLGEPQEDPDLLEDPLAHLVDANMPELTTIQDREFTGPRANRRIEDDTYAHVLVDEAQDLSPMQWRMLGRRGRYSSWTVVGDAAQASWPDAVEAGRAREEAFGTQERRLFHMDTNYRNAREIFDYAAAVVRAQVPDADIPHAVRETGILPVEASLDGDAVATVRAAVEELLAQVDGSVAVITPTVYAGRLAPLSALAPDGAEGRVQVVDPMSTKGLEYDATVVVDPAEITRESPGGVRVLYVALTRAAHRMTVLS
jgi:RecA/RadA recombinase